MITLQDMAIFNSLNVLKVAKIFYNIINNNHKINLVAQYIYIFINRQTLLMIGLSYKQKCNNFGYHSSEVQSKGNDNFHILRIESFFSLLRA